jgi:3-oxoadipate enol-lactonase
VAFIHFTYGGRDLDSFIALNEFPTFDQIIFFSIFYRLSRDVMNLSSIKRDFGELSLLTVGSGPYLLGLSGFACTHYNFIDLVPELQKHFTVVLVDNRGMGKSSHTTKDYPLKALAEDALAVMDQLGAKTFGVMGISMGGFVAQELVKISPERVNALALMCTTSSSAHFIHPNRVTEEGLKLLSTWDLKKQVEFLTDSTVHPTLKEKFPERYQRIINLRMENKADLDESIRQNKAACDFLDHDLDLSFVKCPVLAMAGNEDRFISPKSPELFKSAMVNAQVEVELIPEADHFFFLEKPKIVGEKLNNFFQRKIV